MRKLIAIGVMALIVVCVGAVSYADTIATSKDVVAHLPVDSQFGMTIWDTEFDQYMTNVLPGGGETIDIHISASSNHSVPWFINASSDGLVGENQTTPDTLPVVLTTFDGGAGLTGTVVTDLELTSSAQVVYSAGTGEYPCSALEVSAIAAVTTLSTTKQDIYTGTITITMTE